VLGVAGTAVPDCSPRHAVATPTAINGAVIQT